MPGGTACLDSALKFPFLKRLDDVESLIKNDRERERVRALDCTPGIRGAAFWV